MNICIVIESMANGKGGAERVAASLCNQLIKQDDRVWIMYKGASDSILSYRISNKVKKIAFSFEGNEGEMKKHLDNLNLDIIHIFYYNRRLINFLRYYPDNVKITVQECSTPSRVLNNWRRQTSLSFHDAVWEREVALAQASQIRFTRSEFLSSIPLYLRKKALVFSNSYEPHNYKANVSQVGNDGKFHIIFISGMKANKNFEFFLYAFVKLAEKYDNWVVDVYGYIPPSPKNRMGYVDKVYAYIKENRLSDKVFIHGISNDIYKNFSASHIHVITSKEENFSLSTLEAMSCGVPSVGMKCCVGVRSLVLNEKNGLLVESSDDVFELSEKLEILMDDRNLRKKYGDACLDSLSDYTPEKLADNWNLFFESALAKKEETIDKLSFFERERYFHAKRMFPLLKERLL